MPSAPLPLPGRLPAPRTTETALTLPSLARTARVAGRALRLRCPHCGGAQVLAAWRVGRPWGAVRDRCASCGLRFERSDDHYFAGAMLVNFLTAEFLFALVFLAAVVLAWPDVPWDAVTYGAAAGMLFVPLVCYPASKVLWLAVDVLVRPVTRDELE